VDCASSCTNSGHGAEFIFGVVRAIHAQGRGDSKLLDSAKHAINAEGNQEDIEPDHREGGRLTRVVIVNLVSETKDENQHGHSDHQAAAAKKDVLRSSKVHGSALPQAAATSEPLRSGTPLAEMLQERWK
jgi:hypothetical protein